MKVAATLLSLLCVSGLISPVAHAEDSTPSPSPVAMLTDGKLPFAVIDRPLVLPTGVVAPTLRFDIYNLGYSTDNTANCIFCSASVSGTGAALAAGVDVGIGHHAQLGIAVAIPIAPAAGFGTILFGAAVQLHKSVALRLDIGYNRTLGRFTSAGSTSTSSSNELIAGVGLPIRIRLHRMLCFISGSTGVINYSPFLDANLGGSESSSSYVGAYLPVFRSDLLNYVHESDSGSAFDALALNVPFGLLIQPHKRIALTLRANYTLYHIHTSGNGNSSNAASHYLPVGLDAVVTVVRAGRSGSFLLPRRSGRNLEPRRLRQRGLRRQDVCGGPGHFRFCTGHF